VAAGFGALAASLTLAAGRLSAQSTTHLRQVMFVAPGNEDGFGKFYEVFNSELEALGYLEGRDLSIAVVWGGQQGNALASLAAAIVARKPNLILTATSAYVAAFKNATTTIPIVFATAGDPVGQGLVASLRRPGGNITGVALHLGLSAKLPEVVREALPTMRRLAILGDDKDPVFRLQLKRFEQTARRLGLELLVMRISRAEDLDRAFSELAHRKAESLIVAANALLNSLTDQLVERSLAARLPLIKADPLAAERGFLLGYGTGVAGNYRRAAALADKILRGAKPGEVAVEQPEHFELIVNLKIAKAIGVTLSPTTMLRADRLSPPPKADIRIPSFPKQICAQVEGAKRPPCPGKSLTELNGCGIESPPAEQRLWLRSARLVGSADVLEGSERCLRILAIAQLERIETALCHELQVVAGDHADGAQFAPVAVALAQKPRDGIAATVGVLREIDRDHARLAQRACQQRRIVAGLEDQVRRRERACEPPVFDQYLHRRAS